jgi:hypothetical protein
MQFDIPILLIIFNRPDTSEKVFQEIRKQQPKYLYVAADGPRVDRPDDMEKCKVTRSIIDQIDWECDLKTLYRSENLGCGKAVSGAITWFFDQVEMGIVLEDDCLPNPDFFPYCRELLIKYKDNEKIMWIAGNNCDIKSCKTDSSYYFSKYNHVWGWASWRRAWKYYSYTLDHFDKRDIFKKINSQFLTLGEKLYWYTRYVIITHPKIRIKRKINTWDYQATFSIWMNDGLSILPQNNLITNIGFGENETHKSKKQFIYDNKAILPLIHNDIIIQDKKADCILYKSTYIKPLWKYPLIFIQFFIQNI